MPNYRRTAIPGGTFFFTVVSYRRRKILCNADVREALRMAIRTVRSKLPFRVDAWVLLPDHLHCIWTLPSGDEKFSIRWSMIKRLVTQRVDGARGAPYRSESRLRRREGGLWQRRFWEHAVSNHEDMNRCLDYLHWNPVKHAYVQQVCDWPYSTFHRFVRHGWYPVNWGGGEVGVPNGGLFGE